MNIKDKILENLVPILISILAIITVLPIITYTLGEMHAPNFYVDLVSIFVTLFWMLFFVVYGVSVLIKETKEDRMAYKESARNIKFSFLSVLLIVIGSFVFAEIRIDSYYDKLGEKHLLVIKQKELDYYKSIDSLKAFVGNDSLISTYFFELGKEYIRTDSIKRGFDFFDSALYYHKSSYYYGVISYHLKHSLNNKVKALEYDKKAYALDTSRKYLLNFIKDLENEIEEEKE